MPTSIECQIKINCHNAFKIWGYTQKKQKNLSWTFKYWILKCYNFLYSYQPCKMPCFSHGLNALSSFPSPLSHVTMVIASHMNDSSCYHIGEIRIVPNCNMGLNQAKATWKWLIKWQWGRHREYVSKTESANVFTVNSEESTTTKSLLQICTLKGIIRLYLKNSNKVSCFIKMALTLSLILWCCT